MLQPIRRSDAERKRLKQIKQSLMKDLRIIFKKDKGALRNWLDAPNDRLGGKKPNELFDTPEQQHLVEMVEAVKLGLPT